MGRAVLVLCWDFFFERCEDYFGGSNENGKMDCDGALCFASEL